ncbi:hypothetical protein GOV10_02985, partial [Candidatus Woesearchaeota archaeon]|nr:hypothetical protein [Candidatus Woesearchaeota archaeon]
KSVWEAYKTAGPFFGSLIGAAGAVAGAAIAGYREHAPKFRKAEYLDKRIDELYHPDKNRLGLRLGGMVF